MDKGHITRNRYRAINGVCNSQDEFYYKEEVGGYYISIKKRQFKILFK